MDIMSSLIIASLLIAVTTVVDGQLLDCDWVHGLDCVNYEHVSDVECGSDGITYRNRCIFAKAHCYDNNLHILHFGECQPWEVSTTPPPMSGIDGETAVLDFFCTSLAHRDCGAEIKLVCGTDNWSYLNYCEYDKARCTHRDLHVQNFGACKN